MKIFCLAMFTSSLAISMTGGCRRQPDVETSVNVVSKMATAAAKRDYAGGVAIGEEYLRGNPGDTNVLEQTAILSLAQAKQDPKNRGVLVSRAVLLLDRSLKGSRAQEDVAIRFSDLFLAAHAFEFAGDLSSDKCSYYGRAMALNNEAKTALNVETFKLEGDKEMSTIPLREQSGRFQSELEKRIVESQCGK